MRLVDELTKFDRSGSGTYASSDDFVDLMENGVKVLHLLGVHVVLSLQCIQLNECRSHDTFKRAIKLFLSKLTSAASHLLGRAATFPLINKLVNCRLKGVDGVCGRCSQQSPSSLK